ncbi:hypothetical protein ALC62_04982, partial [Cyphomyrmex costatus]
TTRAAVAYFRGDAPVKYSRIKRRQRPGVNRDELDEWEPSPAPECIRERKISTGSRLQPECRGVSAARENPERVRERRRGRGGSRGPHRPIHETLMNVRGGSSGFNGVARFDLPKVDSGKSGETSGACLPTGRDHRMMMEEVG